MSGFKTEIQKVSGIGSTLGGIWGKLKAGKYLGYAGKGALITGAAIGTEIIAEGAVDAWQASKKMAMRDRTLASIMAAHPELSNFPKAKVEQYFETLYRFSPSLAADPLGAGAFIRQAIRMDEFGGPPPDTIKNLADIEQKAVGIRDKHSLGFKAISPYMGLAK